MTTEIHLIYSYVLCVLDLLCCTVILLFYYFIELDSKNKNNTSLNFDIQVPGHV